MAEPSPLPPRRPSIRSRLSLLLLLSTLNTVATSTAAFILFNAIADTPTQARLSVARDTRTSVDLIEAELVDAALAASPVDRARLVATLADTRAPLEASELWDANTAAEWATWEREVNAVVSPITGVPVANEEALARLRLAHDRLTGRLLLTSDFARPPWVDRATPLLPWFAAWIAIVGTLTVGTAWSLDRLLSRPLAGLANAADRVGGGDLTQEIEVRASVPEIERVARAIAGMRDRLVTTIADVEARAKEMETILSNLSDGVLLTDHQGRILELNRAAQRLLAPPERSRIVGGRLLTQGEAPPSEGAPVERWLPELRSLGADAELEVTRDLPSGRRWFEVATSRVPMGWVVVVRDVTQDRELEKLKRDFLSVITHELKTPLTPIEGYARLLQLGKGGPLTPKQAEYVGVIHAQAGVLKTMVQNLLDATRIEGGTLPIHPQAVEMRGFLDQVGNTWRGNSEQKGLAFVLDNRVPPGLSIQADPFRLEQIVGNLMSNAAKFTPAGGTITFSGHVDGSTLHVTVADTGRGIPPEALHRIFDKFYQVERGDTRAAGGAGLGLYIVRQLVEAMGGLVGVDSEVGRGSRFALTFPVKTESGAT